jgi:hypothetical protein
MSTPAAASGRILHVANGTCTTGLIAAAGLPGNTSLWADPLHDGPVPGGLSDDELVDVRTRHLTGGDDTPLDPVNDLRRWRAAIEARHTYDELVLWYEHDLFDQLNLVQALPWIRERLPSDAAVSLVCIGSFPGRPAFKGLGELSPSELAPLFGDRERVRHVQYALAARAWDAFRADTPEAIDELRRGDTHDLPFLSAALTRLLQEYPWTSDGLSRSERRLLSLAGHGPIRLVDALPRMTGDGTGEGDVYHVTDQALATLAGELSRTSPPLVALTSAPNATRPLDAVLTLTDAGREVLAARADRVTLCGVDRWIGGVHLRGRSRIWRWDDRAQHVRRQR